MSQALFRGEKDAIIEEEVAVAFLLVEQFALADYTSARTEKYLNKFYQWKHEFGM